MDESVENAINDFYKLKNKYERQNTIYKNKIANNVLLSSKERKKEISKLKPKCINCNRPGGTIFSNKFYSNDNGDYRELKAMCGIISNPCNLNINIQIGKYELLTDILNEIENEIKQYKNEIIDEKNKLLFGFITTDEAIQKFEDIKDYISNFTSLLNQYLDLYVQIIDNTEKKNQLTIDIEKSYNYIDQIKESVKNFNENNNTQYIRDAVNIYASNLKPLLNDIANLKYRQQFVHYDEDLKTYYLVQNKYTIKNLEYTSFNDTVVSYDVGFKPETIKQNAKAKTLIIESSTTETESESEPIYDIEENQWNNENYNKLWKNIPEKLKNALKVDMEWNTEFMKSCVNARLNNQPCKLTTPSNLIIPPNKISEDKYDFGIAPYNDLFNKFEKSYQDTLLKLYSDKNGVKDYSMLKDTLTNLLEKEVGFNKGFF
jgi:hypothetical protein